MFFVFSGVGENGGTSNNVGVMFVSVALFLLLLFIFRCFLFAVLLSDTVSSVSRMPFICSSFAVNLFCQFCGLYGF